MSKNKKWSSFKEQQRLTENFRKWVEEEPVDVDEGVLDTVKAGGKKLFAKLTGKHEEVTRYAQRIKQEAELAYKVEDIIGKIEASPVASKFDWKAYRQWQREKTLRTTGKTVKRAATIFLKKLQKGSSDDFLRTSKRGLRLIKYLELLANEGGASPHGYGEIANAILSVLEESKGWATQEDDVPAVYYNIEALQDLASELIAAPLSSTDAEPERIVKHGNYLLQAIEKTRDPDTDEDTELRAEQFFLVLVGGESDDLRQFFKGESGFWAQQQ